MLLAGSHSPWIGAGTIVGEDDHFPVRFMPFEAGYLVVQPGDVGPVRGVVVIRGPFEDVGEAPYVVSDSCLLSRRDAREERAS